MTGVTAHVKGDMAEALARAYRSYSAKYCVTRPLDDYHDDFFVRNKPIFEKVKLSLVNELINRGRGFAMWGKSVDPKVAARAGDIMKVGLDVDEVYKWRETAWQEAKKKLGQP